MRVTLLLLLLPLLNGCYSYTTVEPGAVRPGEDVRARISGAESDRVAAERGGEPARVLEGRLVEVDSTALLLQVPAARRTTAGGGVEVLSQRVLLTRAGVIELETRRLNRDRTLLLLGASAAAVGLIAVQAWRGEPGRDRGPRDGEGPEMIPRAAIRIRF